VNSVALSGDGRTAVSGSEDRKVRVWDLVAGRCSALLEGHTGGVGSVALSGDGRTAVSASEDRTVRVWDLGTGRCLTIFPCDVGVMSVALTPPPPWIVGVGDLAGNVLFFRIETGDLRQGRGISGPTLSGTR
jgi:WD40 repeat protein